MINETYKLLLETLLSKNEIDGTREITNVKFHLDPKENIIKYRNISVEYILAEMIWYFAAKNDLNFIGQFASFWNKLSDDGETCNSAYGFLLKEKHNFNQIDKIIELLKVHPESRRAVLNINTPNENVIQTKDEPCTIALQFYIRDKKLHCTGMMRSNDVWFGLPYDIIFFTELQKHIAKKLKVKVGSYTHFVTSLHMYIRDEEKILKVLDNFKNKRKERININFNKLIDQAQELYEIVNKNNIIEICKQRGILK